MSKISPPAYGPIPILVFVCVLLPMSGCGGGKFPVARAKGKVVCGGQPVTVGSVTFAPIGTDLETGKPATGAVGADGTFVLTTNDRFDGAVIGKHRVTYQGPEGEEEEGAEKESPPEGSPEERAKYLEQLQKRKSQKPQCVQKGELILEVKADGENDFTIELVPAGS
jgi:hypothetical protein